MSPWSRRFGPLHLRVTAWAILGLTLALTALASFLAWSFMASRAEDRFAYQAESLRGDIARRLQVYEMMLRGGVGLFAASNRVTRGEWREYVTRHEIARHYPGVQGMGYGVAVAPADLAAHRRAVRAEGLPDYRVQPEGHRDLYIPIVYLEPQDRRNLRAFGYDMYSEPVRRAAMDRARDTGQAATTDMVTLVQENGADVQKGFLMYLPVYRNGARIDTPAQRRAALLGFVYSPFRVGDFLAEVGTSDPRGMNFALYDGARADPKRLMYGSDASVAPDARPRFVRALAIHAAGHDWTLSAHASPAYLTVSEMLVPWSIGFGGAVIDLLIFIAFVLVQQRNAQAESLARAMTLEARQGSDRLSAILDNMPFLAWLKDADGRFVAVNRPFAKACGVADPAQVVGKTDLDVWPRREALAYIADHEQVMRTGRSTRLERESGEGEDTRWLEVYKAPVLDADGRVVGSTGFSLDVTERKRAEREQERLQLQLRQAQKMEALGRMTGGIAHDFNNILASVLGYTHLAMRLSAPEPDGKMHQYLDQIRLAGERARDLVASMVAYGRTRPGTAVEAIDPAVPVREAVKLLAATIPSSIQVRSHVEDGLPPVNIMAEDLQQILVKLVINARDAMGETGLVEIVLSAREETGRACSICHQTVSGRYVMLEVADSGPGIAADVLPRIFDPFFTTKDVGQGAGLGLSMVQGLIRKAGGHVVVRSQPGQGSVFQVLMPVAV